jgi:hypothetical protein
MNYRTEKREFQAAIVQTSYGFYFSAQAHAQPFFERSRK